MIHKYCPDCKQTKSTDEFYKTGLGKPIRRCKICQGIYMKAYRKIKPQKSAIRGKEKLMIQANKESDVLEKCKKIQKMLAK